MNQSVDIQRITFSLSCSNFSKYISASKLWFSSDSVISSFSASRNDFKLSESAILTDEQIEKLQNGFQLFKNKIQPAGGNRRRDIESSGSFHLFKSSFHVDSRFMASGSQTRPLFLRYGSESSINC